MRFKGKYFYSNFVYDGYYGGHSFGHSSTMKEPILECNMVILRFRYPLFEEKIKFDFLA